MKSMVILLFICLFVTLSYGQVFEVMDVAPVPQSLSAQPQDPITIIFNQPVEASTIDENSFMVFGRWSGPMDGQITISGDATTVTFTPDRSFFYGEWISVRLTYDIEGTSTNVLTHGYGYNYWIKSLPASLNLTYDYEIPMRLSGEGLIQCYGAYAGDINDDEYTDLTVINENSEDIRLLLNDATGNYDNFTLFDMPGSSRPSTNEGSDFNHDGKIDIAIGSTQNNKVSIFLGNNSTLFDNVINYTADVGINGLTVIDMEGDGWDDIATANRIGNNISLLHNDGTGSFGPPTNIDLGYSEETAIGTADLNGDGFMDLIVGAHLSDVIVTLLNDGSGNFTLTDNEPTNGHVWKIALGDVNGDGFVDVASANSSSNSVSILFGDGMGNLNISNHYSVGAFPLSVDLGDIDGDGDLDFVSSNIVSGNFTLWENNGSGIFIDPITYDSELAGSCAILHDKNNDGAMDITFIDEEADVVILYSNTLLLDVNEETYLNNLFVYPNPVQDILTIVNNSGTQISSIKLYDVLGRQVLNGKVNMEKVDVSYLNRGIFFVEIETDQGVITKKIVKK